jgi:hypothetical protein
VRGEAKRPGRRGCCHPRPPQTRTCRFPASGSSRGSFADCDADDHSYRSYRRSVTRWVRHSRHHTSAAIHCRFVYRFVGYVSHSCFPAMVPALGGTTKVLRLPIRASALAYWFAPAAHAFPPALCPPRRPRKAGGAFQARAFAVPATRLSGFARMDANCQTIYSPAPDYGLVVAPPSPPGTILICAGTDCRVMPAPGHLPSERHR